jgi:DNA-binding phage protein
VTLVHEQTARQPRPKASIRRCWRRLIGAVLLPPPVLGARHPAVGRAIWRDIRTAQKDAERGPARVASLPAGAVTALTNAYWPGNVDHLQNVVANLALNAGTGDITPDHVKRLLGEAAATNQAVAPEITARFFELPLREAREAFERIYFEQLLGREQSNMSRVADKAGLERTHLYLKLKQLNIRFARRGDDVTVNGGNGENVGSVGNGSA